MDICAALTPENVARLRRVLADWNPRHRMTSLRLSFLDHPASDQPLNNLYLETDHGVVGIFTAKELRAIAAKRGETL